MIPLQQKFLKLAVPLALLAPVLAQAHGYISQPMSRAVMCDRQAGFWWGTPPTEGCQALKNASNWSGPLNDHGGSQYQGSDYLDYQNAIPDGKLCGNNYTALNAVVPQGDWPTTEIKPNSDGTIDLTYHYTTYHGTDHIAFFVTKENYDPSQPLKWEHLEQMCRFDGPNLPDSSKDIHFKCKLPSNQSGRHLIYAVWPVSGQHGTREAFTTCADVVIKNAGNPGISAWTPIGEGIRAVQDLSKGDKIKFRLFNTKMRGEVAFETEMTLDRAMQGKAWLHALAKQINGNNSAVRVGTLKDGHVALDSAQAFYNVYAKQNAYSYAIYITPANDNENGGQQPGNGPSANAGTSRTVVSTTDWGFAYPLDGSKSAGQGLRYQWEAVDGPFSVRKTDQAKAEAVVPKNKAGTTTYRLTVTDKDGKTATSTTTVTAVVPKVTLSGKSSAAVGERVKFAASANFSGTSEKPLTYKWALSDGSGKTIENGTGKSWTTSANLQAGSYSLDVTAESAHGKRTARAHQTLTVTAGQQPGDGGDGGDGGNTQCAAKWESKAYAGGSKVTRNGRTYVAKWWAEASNVPGNPSVTDTTGNGTGWGLVWEDKGACAK